MKNRFSSLSVVLMLFLSMQVSIAGQAVPLLRVERMVTKDGKIDPSNYKYVRATLNARMEDGSSLPKGSYLFLDGVGGQLRLPIDDAGVAEWPADQKLSLHYAQVGSVPDAISTKVGVRVVIRPGKRTPWSTVESMRAEYGRLIGAFSAFERLMAPKPKGVRIVGVPGTLIELTKGGKRVESWVINKQGKADIPLERTFSGGVLELSVPATRIILDLGQE